MQIQKTKGSCYILGSCVLYSLMACMVKTIADTSVFQITCIRFIVGLLLLCILAVTGVIRLQFVSWRLLFLRGFLGSIGVFATYLAVVKIGISKGMVIIYSYPVWASLFGAFFLKERLQWTNFIALAGAILGLYLLVTHQNGLEGFFSMGLYELLAVIGAIFCGITVVIIRKLHETQTSYEIFFSQCSIGAMMFIVPAGLGSFSIGRFEIMILLAIGIIAAIGQLIMTQGFRYLPVKIASVLAISELIFNYTAGIFIFDESFTLRAFIGSILIFAACLLALLGREKA